ncbi:LamG-like jellyroll fold domain-containing protein [Streptomyces sp. NPDC092296]|uniref:LamG-like jellyroll fold domain-containing protein n=1 Tax=Streptomyces sp. NPDC092296 TaxID=3366012 RepID=UPI00380A2EBD
MTRSSVALLATFAALLAPFSLMAGTADAASPTATALQAVPAAAPVPDAGVPDPGVPDPGILDVDFADGTPTDHAQHLAVTTKGAPAITRDQTAGKAVATFNGTTDAFTYPFSGQWSKLAGGFSVECRFRWNDAAIPVSGQKAICSNAQSGGADLQIDSGQLAFSVNVGGYKYAHAPIVPGRWYDAVATWDGQNVKLYVDGVLASTTAAAGSLTAPVSGAQNWTLGADSAANGGIETPSPVSLSTARVWDSVLAADQVAAFVRQNGAPPPGAPDCTAYQRELADAADAAAGTVVLHEDFSGAHSVDCWNQATGSVPWKAGGGRLVGASPVAGDQPLITFGPHLDDYLFEATARFDSAPKPTAAWFALIADTPAYGARPYPAFALRAETTAADGVRALVQNAASSSVLASAPYGSDLGTGTDVDLALEVHDTLANLYVGGRLVLAGVTIPRTPQGVLGLSLDSAAVSFDQVKVVKLGPLGTAGFMAHTFRLPAVPVSGAVQQPLAGLWTSGWVGQGQAPVVFAKESGDSWLEVNPDGVVTGTAPDEVPQDDGAITVTATDGTTTSQLQVQVPVAAAGAAPQLQSASWNAWDDGGHVTDAVAKNVVVIATQGIGLVGFQDGGAAMARKVGAALGWQVYAAGDLGIVSAYPISDADRVGPTAAAPAAAVTLDVAGTPVRVWDAHLDEADYGPYRACFDGATDLAAHEKTTTRYAQARAIAQEMAGDLSGSAPVLLLGDLASPSGADWTAATAGSHCDAGAVEWPVPEVFAAGGLTDSYRVANPDPETDPGTTWSPITSTHGNGRAEPQDRIDYVWYAGGGLRVEEAHALTVGWPSEDDVADNSWASDHAAAVTTFTLGEGSSAPAPDLPTVSVDNRTIAYQVGHGPVEAAAFLGDIKATADPAGAALTADLTGVDFATPGWYTALVTAVSGRYTSNPVAMTVRVAPVPGLVLSRDTATFDVGATIDEPAVLAQLEPILDVPGAVHVGLADVDASVPAGYPVTVTATDEWGFTATRSATVDVVAAPDTRVTPTVTATAPAATYGTAARVTVTVGSPGLPATGSVTLTEDTADGPRPRGTATLSDGRAGFTLPAGLTVGSHDLTASYGGSDLLTPATATVTVTVGLPAGWTSSAVYDTGDTVGYRGRLYRASWWTQNQQPGDPNGPWQEIALTEDGTAVWTASRIFQAGDTVLYQGTTYQAKWYTRNQVPGDPYGPWAVTG